MVAEDPAITEAKRLIQNKQSREALSTLISRIEELNNQQELKSAILALANNQQSPQAAFAPVANSLPRRSSVSRSGDMTVTTGDIRDEYEIIGPVYFQVSNKGIFSSALSKFEKQYKHELEQMKKNKQVSSRGGVDWGWIIGEFSVGQTQFETAFYIAVQELKKRAAMLRADAIIYMRQDIDMDTTAFQYFYLQMYGTAVKLK